MNLAAFREKVGDYRRACSVSQKALAQALGLHPVALSYKLNGTNGLKLTRREIKQIILKMAEWRGLTGREEALELLGLMDLDESAFSPQEWKSAPLAELKQNEPGPDRENFATNPATEKSSAIAAASWPAGLPAPTTAFVWREAALREVVRLLSQQNIRLVTLTGPGGIGKTRLALQAAALLHPGFKDGIRLVTLDTVNDPSLVMLALVQALGVKEDGQLSLQEAIKSYLAAKELLILFDNFEQVMEAAGLIAEVLAAGPGVKVLVTSREVLHLYGEHEYAVPPFELPDASHTPSLETLAANDAVRLFIERARAANPHFSLKEDNARAVIEICTRLDGLPLAIELAAARMKLFNPQDLLARLNDTSTANSLKILTGGGRNLPGRQQTLRGAINWSYEGLASDEKRLFARLAVFAASFSLEAVEQICGDNSPAPAESEDDVEWLDKLGSLLDKSLLMKLEISGQPESRFSMLKVLRDYALEKLHESGEEKLFRQRYAHYYLKLVEEAEPGLLGSQQLECLAELEMDYDNVRAALNWALEQPEVETGLRFGAVLWRFWQLRSYFREGLQWLEKALAAFDKCQGDEEFEIPLRPVLAKALHGAGVLYYAVGEIEQATERLERSLALSKALQDTPGLILALQHLALVSLYRGDTTTATTQLQEVLKLRQAIGDERGIAFTLNDLGNSARVFGDYGKAQDLLSQSLAIFGRLQNQEGIGVVYRNLGHLAYRQGHYNQSREWFEKSLALAQKLKHQGWTAQNLEGLAGVSARQGRAELAARLWGAAQSLSNTLGTFSENQMRQEYRRVVEAIEQILGKKQYEANLEQGQAADLEELISTLKTANRESDRTRPVPEETATPQDNYSGLSERELEVLRLVARGLTNAEVAERLTLAPRTVNAHLTSIYAKLEVNSRTAAARVAHEKQLI
ncbi:MAG TPA: tetratricopeptide repeat protein [Chloroflexia bacterium]|nr:tetratricopeptide repeat protein [Chloroflexia bacterium]